MGKKSELQKIFIELYKTCYCNPMKEFNRLTIVSLKSLSLLLAEIFSPWKTFIHWSLGPQNIKLAPETNLRVLLSMKYEIFLDFQWFHVMKSSNNSIVLNKKSNLYHSGLSSKEVKYKTYQVNLTPYSWKKTKVKRKTKHIISIFMKVKRKKNHFIRQVY